MKRFLVFGLLLLISLTASAVTEVISQGNSVDTTGDGATDLKIQGGGGNPPTFIIGQNNAEKYNYFGGTSFASLSCTEAIAGSYNSNINFLPEPGDVFFIRDADHVKYSKVRFDAVNPGVSITLTYETLGSCNAGPTPTSSFTYVTYDQAAFFTDTSSDSPTGWNWDFGGESNSSAQNPSYFFLNDSGYSVSLTASNAAGTGTTANQNVTLTQRPSTTSSVGFDLNGDMTNDMVILAAPSGCSNNNAAMQMNGGATYASLNMDYRNVTAGDIPPSITGSGAFCSEEGITALFNAFVVKTSDGAIYKFWSPEVGGTSARIEFELLSDAPIPVPVSSWTHTSYDLIGFFTDTSSNNPGSWDWDFADGGTSSNQNPSHFFPSANTYSVSMTASNNGGDGNTAVADVTVAERPSVIKVVGQGYDFDDDGLNDIEVVAPNGCGGNVTLTPVNGATWAGTSTDYRTLNTAPGTISGISPFCSTEGVGGLFETIVVKTATESIAKFWTPEVSSTELRMEYELLFLSDFLIFRNGFETAKSATAVMADLTKLLNLGYGAVEAVRFDGLTNRVSYYGKVFSVEKVSQLSEVMLWLQYILIEEDPYGDRDNDNLPNYLDETPFGFAFESF